MATACATPDVAVRGAAPCAAAFAAFVALAAALAATLPVQLSIAIVFLFAGPHNWLEARYMLGRLPARAGRLRPFLGVAIGGVAGLAAAFAALPGAAAAGFDPRLLQACWNTALIGWVALLFDVRSRVSPRFGAAWAWPVAVGVALVQWPWPAAFGLAVVFLHPLLSLAVLDRELRRLRPAWLGTVRPALAAVPLGALAVWMAAARIDVLTIGSRLEADVVRHAGIDILAFAPPRPLVATHAFLELVHYGVWIVVLPLVGMRSLPWRLDAVPVVRRGPAWARAVGVLLACGGVAVLVLWAGFVADYSTTRRIYFTLAVVHVLAEIPFLLRPA